MPKRSLIDTGPLVALFNRNDEFHRRATVFLRDFRGVFLTTVPVVTETVYLLDFHPDAQLNFLRWLERGALRVEWAGKEDLGRIIQLFERYSDLPMDLADASLVALAERLDIREIATFDSDFEIYRVHGKSRFTNVLAGK